MGCRKIVPVTTYALGWIETQQIRRSHLYAAFGDRAELQRHVAIAAFELSSFELASAPRTHYRSDLRDVRLGE